MSSVFLKNLFQAWMHPHNIFSHHATDCSTCEDGVKWTDTLLQRTAQQAYDQNKGAWADPLTLTGYEFRMCYKLWDITKKLTQGKKLSTREKYGWVERYCADMTTRQIYEPQDYTKVEPYNRIFIWARDVTDAVGRLNLVPGE